MLNTAFISYSSRYRDWVGVLHRNLTRCFGKGSIFLDEADLGPGRSWVSGLQAGMDRARRFVLVASPEAFASPWVRHELESFLAAHPDWKAEGLLQVALLIDTPLPPFLASVQQVDFRDHDDDAYTRRLEALVATLQGIRDPKNLPPLPEGLEVPVPPASDLPAELRSRLVRVLCPFLEPRYARTAVAARLGLDAAKLKGHASTSLAVSAALTLKPPGRSAIDQARELLAAVLDEELTEKDPVLADELRDLQTKLPRNGPRLGTMTSANTAVALPMPTLEVSPTGTVPVGSKLYVVRESDAHAQRKIHRLPGLIYILGARQMGKSSLILRLIDRARNDPAGPLVVAINFQELRTDTLRNLRKLLVQLTWILLDAAGRNPEAALEIERTPLTEQMAARQLVQREILARHPGGLLVAFDETDRVAQPGGCSGDFFSMLRAWHEAGKQDADWAKLRMALAFCTEAFMVPDGMHESPLANVGERCYLRDFRQPEVERLAGLHGLPANARAGRSIMEHLGGNPYLTRRSLYALAVEGYQFDRLISETLTGDGPLGDHLARLLRHLHAVPELSRAMRRILDISECTDERQYQALAGAGLVRRHGTQVMPRYRLYRDFLQAYL